MADMMDVVQTTNSRKPGRTEQFKEITQNDNELYCVLTVEVIKIKE